MKKMALQGKSWILIFILLFLSSFCKSDDQLTYAKPLTHGDMLVSKGGDFALGFFSPASSNTSLYLGIWYHSIPGPRTVVWVANRDSPIAAASSPMLAMNNNSELALSDSRGHIPWATNNNITGTSVAALLLDTGNLVLQFPNGTIIWQSFQQPTDTILPGTRIFLSENTRVVGRLVAWKSPIDPSAGDFSLSLDTSSNLQVVIWHGSITYTRLNLLSASGQLVAGGIYQNTIIYEALVSTKDGFYYEISVSPGSPYTRVTLDYMGVLRTFSWNNRSSWTIVSEHPSSSCDLYASCGPFGYCDYTGAVATCRCLDGFEPVGLNFSSGCRRTKALECSSQSHFVTMSSIKVPDKSLHVLNRSFDECATECTINCSCTAYAYTNNLSSYGAMADLSRCLVWTRELVDTGMYSSYGENLYLRLSNSPVQKNKKLVKIALPIIACLLILTCIALGICKYRGKQRKNQIQKRVMLGSISSSSGTRRENMELPFISFKDIAAATHNFSDSKQIGRGGFGKVYKADVIM